MKRMVSFLLCLMLLTQGVCAARIGEVVDYALHTDIVAQINGHPLRSYNVNGHTAVVAEDLRRYGFLVSWDPNLRTLEVVRDGATVPDQWPQYTPEGAQGAVGSRARAIYATDIVTTVAGQAVESFNIGGETVIWLSDLSLYGQVSWDEEARIAKLELGDPVQIAVEEMISTLNSWKEVAPESYYETYFHSVTGEQGGAYGVLFFASYSGTPHGTARKLTYVAPVGTRIHINTLLPAQGHGADYYLQPRDIHMEGEMLTFTTPVPDLGDCLCRVNLRTGTLVTLQPFDGPLESWIVNLPALEVMQYGQELSMKLLCEQGQVQTQQVSFPGNGMRVTVSSSGITIYHTTSMLFGDEQYLQSEYAKAYQALNTLNLPRVTQENFAPDNIQQQREQAGKYFCVTVNGQPVSGNLWWGQGNNHVDLQFDFDAQLHLNPGDVVEVWMGMPKQN